MAGRKENRKKKPATNTSPRSTAKPGRPKPARPGQHKLTGWRKWAFRLAATTLIPALFFVLVEIGLRVCGYGYPTGFFVKIDGRDAYTTNQRFGWRFFPPAIARAPRLCELPAEKAPNAYRVFVLGGSAAMGTPDPAFSFGRMLEVMLREAYPETEFEVINAAMTAINSHVVLPIARDCAERGADLFVVYMGNNEVVGPFGSGTAFQRYASSLALIRASIFLKSTRIGQLIGSLAGGDDVHKQWRGMEMFDDRVAADDPRMEAVYEHFRANLEDVCDVARASGAKVVVCTVPSNLRDTAPFAAAHRADLTEAEQTMWKELYESGVALAEGGDHREAVKRFLEATAIDDRHAELHFRLGHALLATGQIDRGGEHLALARDLDTLRFRADTRINEIIRAVARSGSDSGIRLVDAERSFEQSDLADHGIPGCGLFYEHVHMNPEGNYLLAKAVFAQVAAMLPDSIHRDVPKNVAPPSRDRCFERIALTRWNRYRMESDISRMENRPPFTNQLDYDKRCSLRRQRLAELRSEGTSAAALADARRCYAAALERSTEDLEIRRHFAQLLLECGDYEQAAEQWRGLLERFPDMAQWHIELGTALKAQGKRDEAIAEFSRAMSVDPRVAAAACFNIGTVRLEQGELEDAADLLREALDADPDMAEAHISLGAVRFGQGNSQEAVKCFRQALQIAPNLVRAHHDLGHVLAEQHALSEAAEHYRRALEIDPTHLMTYPALASVLARQGKPSKAMEQYRRAVRAVPNSAEAHYRLANVLVTRVGPREAIPEFREALRIDPGHVRAGHNLATALFNLGRTSEAIEQYLRVLEHQASFQPSLHELARIRATHPDPQFRNGAEAVGLMERACGQMPREDPAYLDTLAAAYAEANRFEEALEVAARALKLARARGDRQLASALEYRLTLYGRRKPFRDFSSGNRR